MKSKNLTLIALTSVCFLVAVERIHQFYIQTIPLGSEGSCYEIHYPKIKDKFEMRILENDNDTKASIVEIGPLPVSWRNTYSYTYHQQRMLSPEKMECQ